MGYPAKNVPFKLDLIINQLKHNKSEQTMFL